VGTRISSCPFVNDIPYGLRFPITYPGHKVPVELKARAAVLHHESAYILSIFITLADVGISGELVTVPVETHGCGLPLISGIYTVLLAASDG